MRVEVDHERQRIEVASSSASLDEGALAELAAQLRLHATQTAAYDLVLDFRSVSDAEGLSPESLASLAIVEPCAEFDVLLQKRIAILVGHPDLTTLGRAIQRLLTRVHPRLAVFETRAQAERFFGTPRTDPAS